MVRGAETLKFLIRNLTRISAFPAMPSRRIDQGFLIRGYADCDSEPLDALYRNYSGSRLGRDKRLLMKLAGSRLCIVACDPDGCVVGVNMYYFNSRDISERTVHEGYIGVLQCVSGRGVASAMRRHAIAHFKTAGLQSVSSRIRSDNVASLKSAIKAGFMIEESLDGELYLKTA